MSSNTASQDPAEQHDKNETNDTPAEEQLLQVAKDLASDGFSYGSGVTRHNCESVGDAAALYVTHTDPHELGASYRERGETSPWIGDAVVNVQLNDWNEEPNQYPKVHVQFRRRQPIGQWEVSYISVQMKPTDDPNGDPKKGKGVPSTTAQSLSAARDAMPDIDTKIAELLSALQAEQKHQKQKNVEKQQTAQRNTMGGLGLQNQAL